MAHYFSSIEREGIEKGLQNAFQKAYQEGFQRGFQQGSKRRTEEIAIRMIQKNQSIDFVSEITELSKQELLVLSKKPYEVTS